jgi:hypothetical protein
MEISLRSAVFAAFIIGLDAFLTSTLTPCNHLWSLQNAKSVNPLFRSFRRPASLPALNIKSKVDTPTLKQNLLNLCDQSQKGLISFDPVSKQRFEDLVSVKKYITSFWCAGIA